MHYLFLTSLVASNINATKLWIFQLHIHVVFSIDSMQVVAMAKKAAKPAPKARSTPRTASIEW
jgi:hypothetical protein